MSLSLTMKASSTGATLSKASLKASEVVSNELDEAVSQRARGVGDGKQGRGRLQIANLPSRSRAQQSESSQLIQALTTTRGPPITAQRV